MKEQVSKSSSDEEYGKGHSLEPMRIRSWAETRIESSANHQRGREGPSLSVGLCACQSRCQFRPPILFTLKHLPHAAANQHETNRIPPLDPTSQPQQRMSECMRDHSLGHHPVPSRPAWTTLVWSCNIAYCVIVSPARPPHMLITSIMSQDCSLSALGWRGNALRAVGGFHRRHSALSTDVSCHFENNPSRYHGGISMSRFHCYIPTPLSVHYILFFFSSCLTLFSPMASSYSFAITGCPDTARILVERHWLSLIHNIFFCRRPNLCFISIRHWPRLGQMVTIKQASLGVSAIG
ncbi:hypothetical protein GE21DRAFT_1345569 [Neurospora crassa]|nr:hypothetical protein B2O8.120 [imported] - Neurospora crassa [Neurospora crassa]KHE87110.1 hypothetical protein GE21DRAFT_1345569 [Neurospora crassa]